MNNKAHGKRTTADLLFLLLGLLYFGIASILIVLYLASAIDPVKSAPPLHEWLHIAILFIDSFLLINRRFSGAVISLIYAFGLFTYQVVRPFVIYGFIPDGYPSVNSISGGFYFIWIFVSFFLCVKSHTPSSTLKTSSVTLKKYITKSLIVTASLATLVFSFSFFGIIGGDSIHGVLIDKDTKLRIQNAHVAIKYGSGSFSQRSDKIQYTHGQDVTGSDGVFKINTNYKLITRLQADGFGRYVSVSAAGYSDIDIISHRRTISNIVIELRKREE